MIEIEIKTLELQQNISRAAQGLEQRGSLMRLIAGRLHQAVDENFNSQGRPAWAGLKLGSQLSRAGALTKRGQVSQARFDKHVRNHKILQNTGRLRNSITEASDNDSARVGTNVAYAAIHNCGGQTAAHMIYPRHKIPASRVDFAAGICRYGGHRLFGAPLRHVPHLAQSGCRSGAPNTVLPAGLVAQVGDIAYQTTAAGQTDGSGQAVLACHCLSTGAAGHQPDNTPAKLQSPPAGIKTDAVLVSMVGGTDIESDAALLGRLLSRLETLKTAEEVNKRVAEILAEIQPIADKLCKVGENE